MPPPPQKKKKFRHLNRIRTHGLCVSAAVLYHLSYEDPYIGSRPICWVDLNPWKEWNMKMMWNAEMGTTNSVMEVLYYFNCIVLLSNSPFIIACDSLFELFKLCHQMDGLLSNLLLNNL